MKAIYKRELKSYFSSVIGCIFVAASILISAIFFVLYNMMQGYPNMEPPVFYGAMGLALFVPILTMKVMADERRQKTDQLILTSPVSLFKVVLGKYLALLTIFAIPVLVMCTYPLILSIFGTVSFKLAYTTILGFVLYGAALIAIGVFISSITEMQIIAAIIGVVVMFLGFFMSTITNLISQGGNVITDILSVFDTMSPLNNIMAGQITLSNIVYYVSIIVLFLFLTCQSVQKRRWSVSKNTIGTGVFSVVTIAVVLVLVVFVNLLANVVTKNVPAATVDTTQEKIYSISDKTEKMLSKLDKDINIYVMSSKGAMQKDVYKDYIYKTLQRYEAASSHINVEFKDTKQNPNFYKQYTEQSPTEGSLIIVNKKNKKSKVIDYQDMFVMDQQAAMYGQQSQPTAFDAEGQIDGALTYVQSDELYTIYQVEGHKETADAQALGTIENMTDIIKKHNGQIKTINLNTKKGQEELTTDKCAVLLIMGPQKDYTKSEASLVKKYLEEGGKVIAGLEAANSYAEDKPNFYSIFEAYNIKVQKGLVAENDENCYMPMQMDGSGGPLFAMAEGKEGFADGISGPILSVYSIGLTKKDKKNEDIVYSSLAPSSNKAVLKTDPNHAKKSTKEKGDVSGPFDFVVSVEKNVAATEASSIGTDKANNKQAEMLVFSSVYSLSDSIDAMASNANTEVLSNALDKYIDTDVETVTVAKKSLQVQPLTVSNMAVRICMIIYVIALPILILGLGIITWAVRRKK